MKRSKTKKSARIMWKVFNFMLLPLFLLLGTLWLVQTVLLGMFYGNIKTQELKSTTESVIQNIENNDIQNRIFFLSSNGDINIRVIDTSEFESMYTSGEVFDSVTYGWGPYGMLKLYDEVVQNGGEYSRYYTEEKEYVPFSVPDNSDSDILPEKPEKFREHFDRIPRPRFFENVGRHNDLLYAKTATLSDGSEVMVVADTRMSPLDSTVKTLRIQLIWSSVITIIISLVVSFFVAKSVSRPIEKLNLSAKKLANGSADLKFDARGYREIEELSDTLNYTAVELSKVETLRRELMANVSHDMRTPLTMIVGYGEAMRDIPGENNAENAQLIVDEANKLSGFVNNVLDLSKLQGGMYELECRRINLTQMLEYEVNRYTKLLADSGGIVTIDAQEDVFVVCDETKLLRVITNLLDNAVNYANDPKKVSVKLYVTDKNCARVEISDNGDGIDTNELPYIWDRYYKSNKNHKRNVVGSGIGLSIVKQILTLHKAKFGVETKKGLGSCFWFEIKKCD